MTAPSLHATRTGETLHRIITCLRREFPNLPDDLAITDQTDLVTELRLDSLALITLVVALEDEFGIRAEVGDLRGIATLQDLTRWIEHRRGLASRDERDGE